MRIESRVEEDNVEARFKDMIFANNPEMYQALFPVEVTNEDQENDDFNWVVPQTEQEAKQLLSDVLSGGVLD